MYFYRLKYTYNNVIIQSIYLIIILYHLHRFSFDFHFVTSSNSDM